MQIASSKQKVIPAAPQKAATATKAKTAPKPATKQHILAESKSPNREAITDNARATIEQKTLEGNRRNS